MAKWPNVPAVYGWLSLDRRGNWLIKGERIPHPLVIEFIGRNYARDARGRWFFQNGPQRVFVNLDYAPFVYRVVSPDHAALAIEAHTGKPVSAVAGAWMDEDGAVLLETDLGPGCLHDRDLERLLPHLVDDSGKPPSESALDELLEQVGRGRRAPLWLKFREANVRIEPIASREAAGRFGFIARPEPPAGEEACT